MIGAVAGTVITLPAPPFLDANQVPQARSRCASCASASPCGDLGRARGPSTSASSASPLSSRGSTSSPAVASRPRSPRSGPDADRAREGLVDRPAPRIMGILPPLPLIRALSAGEQELSIELPPAPAPNPGYT